MTDQEYREQGTAENGRQGKRKQLTGSLIAKTVAFFLLAASSFVAAASIVGCIIALTEEFYSQNTSYEEVFENLSSGQFSSAAYQVWESIQTGRPEREIRNYFDSTNLDVDILSIGTDYSGQEKELLLWGTNNGAYAESPLIKSYYIQFYQEEEEVSIGGQIFDTEETYIFRVYMKPDMPQNDQLRQLYAEGAWVFANRYVMIWTSLAGVILAVICFLFLMCSAGHSNRRSESQGRVYQGIFLDVLTAVFLLGAAGIVALWGTLESFVGRWEIFLPLLLIGGAGAAGAVWLTCWLYIVACQFKQGKWWRHTLIYVAGKLCLRVIKFLGRGLRAFFRSCGAVFKSIPTILSTLILYLGLCISEFLGCLFYVEAEGVLLWALEKIILLPVVLYLALICKRLLQASEALAEGDQNYVVDTTRMVGDFKTHGENLNSIGQGISRAVAERMKSEHLKTELITNVSHDLKTPLTSIINYSSLICEEETENERITEYSQVLLRQSGRLKKLLEDLVEASKATTGNLEVSLVPCEVGVILAQAVGEYQEKLAEKELDLIMSQPEEAVRILADGRHLWRVFDNLLNNICKYAQEHSRVYLSVELTEREVRIIFRNMSKYPLNISPEELEERFVRGDKSRHMEGNGLGLSIARSLMDLQEGRMDIVTDGDLFKVTLTFLQLKE